MIKYVAETQGFVRYSSEYLKIKCCSIKLDNKVPCLHKIKVPNFSLRK